MNKEPAYLIDRPIVDEIHTAVASLKGDPKFDLIRQHRVYYALEVEASKRSTDLEYMKGKRVKKGRARNAAIERLEAARSYFHDNYKGDLDDRLIMGCAELIEPSLRPVSYRSPDGPTTMAAGMGLIYPSNVAEQITEFLPANNSLPSFLDRAVHAHFHLTRIHPFKDGNGRLGRLVQNGILAHDGLPPIIIGPFDRAKYLTLLNSAQKSFINRGSNTSEVSSFYTYLAGKLRYSLLQAKSRLAS